MAPFVSEHFESFVLAFLTQELLAPQSHFSRASGCSEAGSTTQGLSSTAHAHILGMCSPKNEGREICTSVCVSFWSLETALKKTVLSEKLIETLALRVFLSVFPYVYAYICVHVCVLSHFSHIWLCSPVDCSLPSSSVHGILQARILEWVATRSSSGSSQPRDRPCVSHISCIGRQVGILVPWPGIEPEPLAVKMQSPYHWTRREFPRVFFSHLQINFLLFRHLDMFKCNLILSVFIFLQCFALVVLTLIN